MDLHIWRRAAVGASLVSLVLMGIQHPGNAVLQPGILFGSFAALFGVVTVGLAAYFEYGTKVFAWMGQFLRSSEALIVLVGIAVVALTMLGAASWAEMVAWQRIVFPLVASFGIGAAFWEYLSGIAPDAAQGQPH